MVRADNERFDLIEMSLIDTWAATGAGAYSLSENGLYTVEGWKHFLDALTPNGIYTVSRWYNPANVSETGRVVSLAMTALRAHGVDDPRTHIFLAARRFLRPSSLAPPRSVRPIFPSCTRPRANSASPN